MISVEECRKILEDYKSTDQEIEEIRDNLQLWVELAFDNMLEERKQEKEGKKKIK